MALLKRAEDRVVYPILNRLRSPEGTAPDKIVEFLHSWAKIAVEQRNTLFLPILMSFEFLGTDDPIERQVTAMYNRIYAALSEVITRGREAGELKVSSTIQAQVAVLVSITDGRLLEWLRRSSTLSGPDVTRALRSVVLEGLVEPSRVSAPVSKVNDIARPAQSNSTKARVSQSSRKASPA